MEDYCRILHGKAEAESLPGTEVGIYPSLLERNPEIFHLVDRTTAWVGTCFNLVCSRSWGEIRRWKWKWGWQYSSVSGQMVKLESEIKRAVGQCCSVMGELHCRMEEPIPKRPRLEKSAEAEKVDIRTFECPLCMSTWDIIMLDGIPWNQEGHFVANCQNCKQWGRGKILCFSVSWKFWRKRF